MVWLGVHNSSFASIGRRNSAILNIVWPGKYESLLHYVCKLIIVDFQYLNLLFACIIKHDKCTYYIRLTVINMIFIRTCNSHFSAKAKKKWTTASEQPRNFCRQAISSIQYLPSSPFSPCQCLPEPRKLHSGGISIVARIRYWISDINFVPFMCNCNECAIVGDWQNSFASSRGLLPRYNWEWKRIMYLVWCVLLNGSDQIGYRITGFYYSQSNWFNLFSFE